MKIFFLVQNLDDPSARIRVINLIPELSNFSNIYSLCNAFEKKTFKRIFQIVKSRKFDIIFIQKKLIPIWQLLLLKLFAKRIVFDFDDAIFSRDLNHKPLNEKSWYSLTRYFRFKYVCKFANLIIAGNSYLAFEAQKYNRNVIILPSSVPLNKNICRSYKYNHIPVIGWIGTEGNFKYLKSIEQSLVNIALKEKFIFRVISSQSYKIGGVNCDFVLWNQNTQETEIALFDIGLMPLDKTPWTEGKCSYKLLQYLSCGVPFVASAVGMNIEVAKKSCAGFVVNNSLEFEKSILLLLRNPKLRHTMGEYGVIAVNKYYSTEIIAKRMVSELFNLMNRDL